MRCLYCTVLNCLSNHQRLPIPVFTPQAFFLLCFGRAVPRNYRVETHSKQQQNKRTTATNNKKLLRTRSAVGHHHQLLFASSFRLRNKRKAVLTWGVVLAHASFAVRRGVGSEIEAQGIDNYPDHALEPRG